MREAIIKGMGSNPKAKMRMTTMILKGNQRGGGRQMALHLRAFRILCQLIIK